METLPAMPGFVISGPPRTKKTSNKIIQIPEKGARKCAHCHRAHGPEYCQWCNQSTGGFPKIMPSDAYLAWLAEASNQALIIKGKLRQRGYDFPICDAVGVNAQIYRDADRGDLCGFAQAIGDFLQDVGIILDDKLIDSWDGSRRHVDKSRPRVEIEISILRRIPRQEGIFPAEKPTEEEPF